MSDVKFLSINKQFRRLFDKPIDPTMTWDSLSDLEAYVSSPTSYLNQIVGCSGKAYIIVEKNGEKALLEIGTVNSSQGGGNTGSGSGGNTGNIEIPDNIIEILNGKADKNHKHKMTDIEIDENTLVVAGYHIGPTPPKNTSYLWIDTSETTIDQSFDSIVMDEIRNIISSLKNEIKELKEEVEYLKQNGGGSVIPPIIPDDDINNYILFEDGEEIFTESGENLLLEININNKIDNLITEMGEELITEDGISLISETSIAQVINKLLTENNEDLMTEDNNVFILE